jgi:hypothetical protein
VQETLDNAHAWHAFCQWILQQSAKDPIFRAKALFMDESCFTRTGITNIHKNQGCLKIILDGGLVTDVKLQFPGLHSHLTWILSTFFSLGIFENHGPCHYIEY